MLFHPSGIAVHPCLQELFAGLADAASLIEQPIFGLDEGFGQAKRWGCPGTLERFGRNAVPQVSVIAAASAIPGVDQEMLTWPRGMGYPGLRKRVFKRRVVLMSNGRESYRWRRFLQSALNRRFEAKCCTSWQ